MKLLIPLVLELVTTRQWRIITMRARYQVWREGAGGAPEEGD